VATAETTPTGQRAFAAAWLTVLVFVVWSAQMAEYVVTVVVAGDVAALPPPPQAVNSQEAKQLRITVLALENFCTLIAPFLIRIIRFIAKT
jgi:hypothetical protein